MTKLKFVEDFRDQYKKKKEIWIFGAGPNLDRLSDDFFDDKISIGINWTFIAFPKCSHFITTHTEPPKYLLEKQPTLLKKCILGLPLATGSRHLEPDALGKYKMDPIYFYWQWIQGKSGVFQEYLGSTIKQIMAKKPCKYICFRTNIHYAIQIAIVFGAKRIILVGCDAEESDGKTHAQDRDLSSFYKKRQKIPSRMKWEKGTKLLANGFKPHGIKIFKYSPEEQKYAEVI